MILNQCLKHCDVVGMANFAPVVNTRGAIFTHKDGILKRSTYFVFELYTKYMGDEVVDAWIPENCFFDATCEDNTVKVPYIDVIPTISNGGRELRVAVVNRHPDQAIALKVNTGSFIGYSSAKMYSISGKTKDSYNDIDKPDEVKIIENTLEIPQNSELTIEINPHSVNVIELL